MKKEVFFSYSRDDESRAKALQKFLEEQGISVWLDQSDTFIGEQWMEAIVDALEECEVLLFLMSSAGFESQHALTEVKIAYESEMPILPIRIDDTDIPKKFRFMLAGINYLELGEGDSGHQNILRSLARLGLPRRVEPPKHHKPRKPQAGPLERAERMYAEQKYADAVVCLLDYLSEPGAKRVDANKLLGRCHQRLGELQSAVDAFENALVIDPTAVDLHLGKAQVLVQRKEFDAALACYKVALTLDPSAHTHLVQLQVALEAEIEGNPPVAMPYFLQAQVIRLRNGEAGGVALAVKAVELWPSDELDELKNRFAAWSDPDLTGAIESRRASLDHFKQGERALAEHDLGTAVEQFELSREPLSDGSQTKAMLQQIAGRQEKCQQFLEAARAVIEQGDLDEGRAQLEVARSHDGSNPEISSLHLEIDRLKAEKREVGRKLEQVRLSTDDGRYQDARRFLQEAMQIGGRGGEVSRLLAEVNAHIAEEEGCLALRSEIERQANEGQIREALASVEAADRPLSDDPEWGKLKASLEQRLRNSNLENFAKSRLLDNAVKQAMIDGGANATVLQSALHRQKLLPIDIHKAVQLVRSGCATVVEKQIFKHVRTANSCLRDRDLGGAQRAIDNISRLNPNSPVLNQLHRKMAQERARVLSLESTARELRGLLDSDEYEKILELRSSMDEQVAKEPSLQTYFQAADDHRRAVAEVGKKAAQTRKQVENHKVLEAYYSLLSQRIEAGVGTLARYVDAELAPLEDFIRSWEGSLQAEMDAGMVWIPAGNHFPARGRSTSNKESMSSCVFLDGFAVDQLPVTNDEYGQFLEFIRESGDHSQCHDDEPREKLGSVGSP